MSQLHVRLFGHLQLLKDHKVVSHLSNRKAGSLLAYLARHLNQPHAREVLIDIIWPDADPASARGNLRFVLSTLRKELEPPGTTPGSILRTDNASVELRADAVTTDVAEFLEALDTAAQKGIIRDQQSAMLGRAVDLYHGDLLLGFYEEWVIMEREHLREQYRIALSTLAQLWAEQGRFSSALRYAALAVDVDGLREQSHTDLIRLHMAAGDRSSALRQYRRMERMLQAQIGHKPSEAARALLGAIRRADKNLPPTSKPISLPSGGGADRQHAEADEGVQTSSSRDIPLSAFPLPAPLTKFFDRAERAQAISLIRSGQSRLVTFAGTAGSGKTRLAIEVASGMQDQFHDAVLFIPTLAYNELDTLAGAVFDALRLQRSPVEDPLDQIAEVLGREPSLLILDNFEHLAKEGAGLINELLQRAPTLICLVTSRVRLGILGEQIISLAPLQLPSPNDIAGTLNRLAENPCVSLLLDRVRMIRPDFTVTPANARDIVALCRRLEGVPLAIELAAPWLSTLSLAEVLKRLEQPFELLVSSSVNLPERHRSLHNAIQSSYDLLPAGLQKFFCKLCVFTNGFTLDAVQEVLEEPLASEYLRRLQEYSLVSVNSLGRTTRFFFLDSVRSFAWHCLSEDERLHLERRHAEFHVKLGFEAESHLSGADLEQWLDDLELRLPNFRAALEWCRENNTELYVFLAASLWTFWYLREHAHEGRAHLKCALLSCGPTSHSTDQVQAKANLGLACLCFAVGDLTEGRPLLKSAIWQYQQSRSSSGVATHLSHLSDVARFHGDYELSSKLLAESLVLWREIDADPTTPSCKRHIAEAIRRTGDLAYCTGNLPDALQHFQEALRLFEDCQDRAGVAFALMGVGIVARSSGDYKGARLHLREALRIRTQLSDENGIASIQRVLADVACRQERFADAQVLLDACVTTFGEKDNPLGTAAALSVAGVLSLGVGDIQLALQQLREADEVSKERGHKRRRAYIGCSLTLVHLAAGHAREATTPVVDALRWFLETQDLIGQAFAIEVCAVLLATRREYKEAARFVGCAGMLRATLGAPLPPAFRTIYERHLEPARAAFGAGNFVAAEAEGATLPVDRVLSHVSLLEP